MDVSTLHRRTVEAWAARVAAVGNDQWDDPTPCTEWSVRDLVNHVVGEELWAPPLLRGKTIEEVGSQYDGDVLGDDPLGKAQRAAADASGVVDEIVPGGGKVQLSYGEEDMAEYIFQLTADHLIHGWDLAAATGGDRSMDPDIVADVAAWFEQREAMYRNGGATGPRPSSTADDPQSELLASFGRSADWTPAQP